MEDIVEGLNPAQAEAVQTLSGPVCILAGAGSGKTKTLTHRIANLLKHGISPERILAVTFTNKAAGEMRERLWGLTADPERYQDPNAPVPRYFMPYMGTFHSICVKILREEHEALGLPKFFTIYDTSDQAVLVRQVAKRLGYSSQVVKARQIQNLISAFKNEGEAPEDLDESSWGDTKKAVKIYREYEKEKAAAGALDFDDLLLKVEELFYKDRQIRQKWSDCFDHILIDEYQDTSKIQYRIIRALVNKEKNICVVGDDWQSIYSWRGADYTNILNFEKDFPGAKVIRLEENYRSTGNILAVAEKLINHNVQRTDKRIFTNYGAGAPVVVKMLGDSEAEVSYVCHKILEMISAGIVESYADIAVLYRTNAQSSLFEHGLLRYKIPYRIVGGLRFYDRAEVKDVISLLQFFLNRKDFVALKRISKNVLSGVGDVSYDRIVDYLKVGKIGDEALDSLLTARARDAIKKLCAWMLEASNLSEPADIVRSAINSFQLIDRALADVDKGEERAENLKALAVTAESYTNLADFLADAALLSSADEAAGGCSVTLMTMHAAKGLEYKTVFLTGLEEGIFPSYRAVEEGDVEEERRLAYVGMTRACRYLYLTYAGRRSVYNGWQFCKPSRFLMDIDYDPDDPDSFADYPLGDEAEAEVEAEEEETILDYDPFPPDLPIFE